MKSSVMYKNAYADETIYITDTASKNYADEPWYGGDKTILVNAAMVNTSYIRLPEATTANAGMHIRVVYGLAPAAAHYVGFVTSKIVGGASTIGAATEGNAPTAAAMVSAAVGSGYFRVELDVDAAAKAGGHPGTVLDFWYTGVANVVLYRGWLHADVDDATLSTHFVATAVNA